MQKNTLKTIIPFALVAMLGDAAGATPQGLVGTTVPVEKAVHPAFSPVPPGLRPGAGLLLQIRDIWQTGTRGGGGCWQQCFDSFDECLGTSEKPICVTRVKTCMETCDRLSGMANPTQR